MPTAANAARGTRMLYLDDSGAISPKHSSGAVVIGGLSVSSTKVPRMTRRISGAKAHHFPNKSLQLRWQAAYHQSGLTAPVSRLRLNTTVRPRCLGPRNARGPFSLPLWKTPHHNAGR